MSNPPSPRRFPGPWSYASVIKYYQRKNSSARVGPRGNYSARDERKEKRL